MPADYELVTTEWREGRFIVHLRDVESENVYQHAFGPVDAAKLAQGVIARLPTEVAGVE